MGSPFRLSNWLNWLTPLPSRHTISPSRIAVCTGSLASDRPETVVFQLENVIGMVEGLPHQTEPHGADAREHNSSLSPAPLMRPGRTTPRVCRFRVGDSAFLSFL